MNTKESIEIGGKRVVYTLRRDKRARCFRITAHDDGHCVVTVPYPFGKPSAEKYLRKHKDWLLQKLSRDMSARKLLSGYYNREEYVRMKERARRFVFRELKTCNALYGFSYTGVSIRNQRSRWGSCSSNGRLSFHYKIILLPQKLARYVIVHELCHLKELNHSQAFWNLVKKGIPEYKQLRKELQTW